jgi:hypothetical protein
MAKLKKSVPEPGDTDEVAVAELLAAIADARDQAKKAYEFSPSAYCHAAFVACCKVAKLAGK